MKNIAALGAVVIAFSACGKTTEISRDSAVNQARINAKSVEFRFDCETSNGGDLNFSLYPQENILVLNDIEAIEDSGISQKGFKAKIQKEGKEITFSFQGNAGSSTAVLKLAAPYNSSEDTSLSFVFNAASATPKIMKFRCDVNKNNR